MTKRWLLGCFLSGFILLDCVAHAEQASASPVSLQGQLQVAVQAFEWGHYEAAAGHFSQLTATFGQEPEYERLTTTILPLWAYAETQSGDATLAIELFEKFLNDFPGNSPQRAFALYTLAQAYQRTGQADEAIQTYQHFIESSPDSPEAIMSAMRQGELLFELGQNAEGIERLVDFSKSDSVPPSLQAQALLRAIQRSQELGDNAYAAELLLSRQWNIQSMPELAVLAFSALKAADAILQGGEQLTDAVSLYLLVPPQSQLIALQEERLAAMQYALRESRSQASKGIHRDAVWSDYFRAFIERIEVGLETLHKSEDYTPAMQMRLGQAFLLLGRSREACVLFKFLAGDTKLSHGHRAAAHYRWILSLKALQSWDASLLCAQDFLENYPQHSLVPDALFLIANACQEQGRFRDAVEVLDELISAYPSHRQAPRWVFSQGINRALAGDNVMARQDFETYLKVYPDGLHAAQAQLWVGLTWLFEKEYEAALKQFDKSLATLPPNHPSVPELRFRRASTLYSMRDYASALAATEVFLKEHPEDQRAAEARVLRGDILMGQGELLAASTAFAQVQSEAGSLFHYAIFQRAKIFRALAAYDLMTTHLQQYLERDDVKETARRAEALYWIGWAWQQRGKPEVAFPVFLEVLRAYGNDPDAGDVHTILQALQKLRAGAVQALLLSDDGPAMSKNLLTADSFESFLVEQSDEALQEQKLTWYARVSLYLAQLYDAQNNPDRAEALRWSVIEKVPLEYLDARGLGELGLILQEGSYDSAQAYFERLLSEYPDSQHVAAAYYGLAQSEMSKGNAEAAITLLRQFREVTPLHKLAPKATLLYAEALLSSGQADEAIEALEEILRLKSARGRPHAMALLVMADAYASRGESDKAIAYYQRVYTAYRAYTDLLETAYLRSAEHFEDSGDVQAAYRTYAEMLRDTRLRQSQGYALAQKEHERLERLVDQAAEHSTAQNDEVEARP